LACARTVATNAIDADGAGAFAAALACRPTRLGRRLEPRKIHGNIGYVRNHRKIRGGVAGRIGRIGRIEQGLGALHRHVNWRQVNARARIHGRVSAIRVSGRSLIEASSEPIQSGTIQHASRIDTNHTIR
jgi:hypothetical protein